LNASKVLHGEQPSCLIALIVSRYPPTHVAQASVMPSFVSSRREVFSQLAIRISTGVAMQANGQIDNWRSE
jgi:hypothetical protein